MAPLFRRYFTFVAVATYVNGHRIYATAQPIFDVSAYIAMRNGRPGILVRLYLICEAKGPLTDEDFLTISV